MPSVIVDPENPVESPAGGPVVDGVQLRRPTSRDESHEPLRQVVDLGNGATRSYHRGIRRVWSYAWGRLTEAEKDELAALVAAPYVTLSPETGAPPVVVSTEEAYTATPIPGTFPVRYTATMTLRERDPIRR